MYSHLHGIAKSKNVEVGINVEGRISWKKLVHKCNKRGVGGTVGGGWIFFFKINKRDFMFISEMRVMVLPVMEFVCIF